METGAAPRQIAFDRFVYDSADARLTGPDGQIRIGNKALAVLDALIAARGRLLTKDELFDTVWDGTIVSESALTSVIKELRRALGDDRHEARFIESVYGRGYRFLAPVKIVADARELRPDATPRPSLPAVQAGPGRRPVLLALGGAAVASGVGVGAILWRRRDTDTDADADTAARVAVLPFANMSGRADENYFADGMTEELRGRLARLASLEIAARASSSAAQKAGLDAQAIGQKLGVRYVIDGSVRRAGDVVRISATLIDARTGFERWSQSYDRMLDDIFAIQSDIAQAVVTAVQGRLEGSEASLLGRSSTTNPNAFDAYAKGRALFDLSGDEATYRAALAAFDRAIALDPNYAAAYAQRSRVLVSLANQFAATGELRSLYNQALASARQAVALDARLDVAQAALGYALVNGSLDFAGAAGPYRRAALLGPANPDVLIPCGLFAVRSGDASGLSALDRAAALDPLNPRPFLAQGAALIALRRYADALAPLHKALQLAPGASGYGVLGDALLLLGRNAEARDAYRREALPFIQLTGLAIAERRLGEISAAEAAFAGLRARGDAVAYQEAQVLSQWGDKAGALSALDTAFHIGDSGLIKARTDPFLAPLAAEPRFRQLLAKLAAKR